MLQNDAVDLDLRVLSFISKISNEHFKKVVVNSLPGTEQYIRMEICNKLQCFFQQHSIDTGNESYLGITKNLVVEYSSNS